jgi:hypothetical protein
MNQLRKPALLTAFLTLAALLAIGCTYNGDDAPQSTTRPADAALKDPYGKWSNVNSDISGGGVSNLNRDALKRDMDSFLLK